MQAISRALAGEGAGVLSIDFRGHGRSGGRSTVGAEEIHDVAAAVAWMRAHGYQRVAVLGWSMGGSAVLRYAGLGGDTDAVVSVSSPARWYERGTRPMRIVHWLCETRTGRVVLRVSRRTRLDRFGWTEVVPEAPHEVAGLIAPTPLLIVHGDADRYFPLPHVHLLRDSAPSAEVWIEPGHGPRRERDDARSHRADRRLVAARRARSRRPTPRPGRSATMERVTDGAIADPAGSLDSDGVEYNFAGSAVVAALVGVALAWPARTGALGLLVAIAAAQALFAFAFVLGLRMPGRIGAIVIAALTSAAADVAVSVWPHARLGTLLAVFGLAMPVLFVHQLFRGTARVRVRRIARRHRDPRPRRGLVARADAAAARVHRRQPRRRRDVRRDRHRGGALVVGFLVDLVFAAPRFDEDVPRGLFAVDRIGRGRCRARPAHPAQLEPSSPADGPCSSAPRSARWWRCSPSPPRCSSSGARLAEAGFARRARPVVAVLLPLSLLAPVAFLLCLAVRA